MTSRSLGLALIAACLAAGPAPRLSGQGPSDVVVGMSAAFSGPSAALGRDMRMGLEAAFRRVNDAGGVAGRRIRLVALDDSYQAEPVAGNMARLIDRERVLAVVGSVGTAGATVAVPIANERKVPFFGAMTGADLLRKQPPDRYVINFRASYAEETQVMVRGLLKRGIKPQQIAFFTQNDGYGDSGYAGALRALQEAGFADGKSLLHGRYERGTVDVDEALLAIARARVRPRAIIMVGTYAACAKFILLAKQLLPGAMFLNVSFVGSTSLSNALGDQGENVVVTQVVPHYDADLPAAAEYRQAMRRYFPDARFDFVSLEGFLTGKTFVEALRRVRGDATREGIIDALERAGTLDIGIGVPLRFSSDDHQGSHHVWPTVIQNRAFVPFEW